MLGIASTYLQFKSQSKIFPLSFVMFDKLPKLLASSSSYSLGQSQCIISWHSYQDYKLGNRAT